MASKEVKHEALKMKRKNKENPTVDPKRKKSDTDSSDEQESPLCKYGEKCYQKNSYHLKKFRHPHREIPVVEAHPKIETVDEKVESNNLPVMAEPLKPETSSTSLSSPEHSSPTENQVDEDELPPSPIDVKENINQKFLVDMPDDFYQFWEFCQSICEKSTLETFKNTLGIELVGPFELLDKSKERKSLKNRSDYLTQWRFYYDPPEFQCVMVGDLSKGYHIGYFRDSPKELPVFVGSNTESEGCIITPMSDNLFSALSHLISAKVQKADPFKKTQLASLKKQLEDWTNKYDIPMDPQSDTVKRRRKLIVAKTFYECGIVVPVNKKTKVGYRKIPDTDANIKKICKKIADSPNITDQNKNFDALQELVTYVQYANDESDYGMGLELGLDLLAFGGEVFHSNILHLLNVAYELLERPEFSVILKAHLKERRKFTTNKAE